jgi:hypothetical protein
MNCGRDNLGWEAGQRVLVEWPEQFRPREQLSASTVRQTEVRMLALRYLCGLESRSMASVARELGISTNAVSIAFTRLARGLGLEHLLKKTPATRAKLSAATSARWARKKNRQSGEAPAVPNPKTNLRDDDSKPL